MGIIVNSRNIIPFAQRPSSPSQEAIAKTFPFG
jgi:hypothetical protein